MSDISARSARDKWIQGVHARNRSERLNAEMEERRERWKEEEDARLAAEAEAGAKRKAKLEAMLAEAAKPRKVLVSGDAKGSFSKLFSTVEAQAAKAGPFNVLLCVGDFLPQPQNTDAASAAYFRGEKEAPLETYFVDSGAALLQAFPKGRSFGSNLHFLGGYGVKSVCGLRVAYLSGRYDKRIYDREDVDFVGGAYTARAVSELRRLALEEDGVKSRGVDVLLTCDWPAGVEQKVEASQLPPADAADAWRNTSVPALGELVHALEPRYHLFGAADLFYQRPPFKAPRRGHACRCIGLGNVGSAGKQRKWLHALALGPMAYMKQEELRAVPAGTTASPFAASKRPAEEVAGAHAAKRRKVETVHDEALSASTLAAILAGDGAALTALGARLASAPLVVQSEETAATPAGASASNAAAANGGAAGSSANGGGSGGGGAGAAGEEETEEAIAAREAAKAWLKKQPRAGVVRYTFSTEGSLGLRLSRDVPPWILEVKEGSLSYKKVPRVPLGGIVLAVNGYELTEKGTTEAIKALAKRPVVLDVQWPEDQGKPTVNRA
eukprot:TRINITY_DN4412_c0_g4_i1.p1 TRINITY_DN4412_c0_g4~~TRINITY_DN4412_c0_g4_i1.p1  ORF type:complete len:555 (+),score=137.56 TRINITY_DN4412_c0_g4_i1:127-1791(+)